MKLVSTCALVTFGLLCLGISPRAHAQGQWTLGTTIFASKTLGNGGIIILSGPKGTVSEALTNSGPPNTSVLGSSSAVFDTPITWTGGILPSPAPTYTIKVPCRLYGSGTSGDQMGSGASASPYSLGKSLGGNTSYDYSYADSGVSYSSAITSRFSLSASGNVHFSAQGTATATITLN